RRDGTAARGQQLPSRHGTRLPLGHIRPQASSSRRAYRMPRMKTVPIGLLLLGLLAPFAAARATTECALEYRFTAHWDAKPRRFEVELLFDAEGRSQTQVRIAREWAGVADFERGVRDVRPGGGGIAVSEGSEPRKTWKVAHPEGGRVSVKYD